MRELARPHDQGILWLFGRKRLTVFNYPAKFGGHCGSVDMKYLICHVTLQFHVIKESCNLLERKCLLYVTTLLGLAAEDIAVLEICFKLFTWPCKTTWSNDLMTFRGKPLILYLQLAEFGSHRYCGSGYKITWSSKTLWLYGHVTVEVAQSESPPSCQVLWP